MRHARLGIVCLWVISSIAASAAADASTCTSDKLERELLSCPSSVVPLAVQKRRHAQLRVKPPKASKRKTDAGPPAPPPEVDDPRPRERKLGKRSTRLLLGEIRGVERLLAKTPKQSPDRPKLRRRLAMAYSELAAASARDHHRQRQIATKPGRAERAKRDARRAAAREKKARQRAIGHLKRFVRAHAKYAGLDEVLYQLAYEQELAGNLSGARKAYLELVQRAPGSKYVPKAYVAFGELFFVEAMADPAKWSLASDAYRKAIQYPLPANTVHLFARYKLAYVHWNTDQLKPALSEMKRVIELGTRHSSSPGASALVRAARRDVVTLYAKIGRPNGARRFFRALSGDPPGESQKTLEMLERLGEGYLDIGQYRNAIRLYRDLSRGGVPDRVCHYQAQIVEATAALESSNKRAQVLELEKLAQIRERFEREKHPASAKRRCRGKTAELYTETAMAWHLEAVGSGGARGTFDELTLTLASKLYAAVRKDYTKESFRSARFLHIVEADRPSLCDVRYAAADLAYEREDWETCGAAFDEVVSGCGHTDLAPEAAYGAVQCYKRLYDRQYAGDAELQTRGLQGESVPLRQKLAPKPLTQPERAMLGGFKRYLCHVRPDPKNERAVERVVDVKFARARTYYDAQHWEEAAILFRDIAEHPVTDSETGIHAAHLYLEAANVLGARFDRPACFEEMGRRVPKLAKRHCRDGNSEPCDRLTRISCDLRRRQAEVLVAQADAEGGDDRELYRRAGDELFAIWKEHGETPLRRGEPATCGRMEEVLYNAAKAYQAGRYLARSIEVRQRLLHPDFGLSETDAARKATYELGGNYQAIAVYDRAADYYEQYARMTAYRGEHAPTALRDAVVLRLGLGQSQEAMRAATSFRKHFGVRRPKDSARIALAIALHHADLDDWAEARRVISSVLPTLDRRADLDVRIQAHALHGRASVRLGRAGDARRAYARVLRLWEDPKASIAHLEKLEKDPARRARRIGRSVEAVGEALFARAEEKRRAADAVAFPEYGGPKTRHAVLAHVQGPVKKWLTRKQPLIREASKSYERILDLAPAAPPQWVIAAGARVGHLWGDLVRNFRDAPVPDAIRRDPILFGVYTKALDEASEPWKLVARGAYDRCLSYSAKFQFFDHHSRSCEAWLAENYRAEYHLIDEFRGSPSRIGSTLRERARPVGIGGSVAAR